MHSYGVSGEHTAEIYLFFITFDRVTEQKYMMWIYANKRCQIS
jgi:hypothetical protein